MTFADGNIICFKHILCFFFFLFYRCTLHKISVVFMQVQSLYFWLGIYSAFLKFVYCLNCDFSLFGHLLFVYLYLFIWSFVQL